MLVKLVFEFDFENVEKSYDEKTIRKKWKEDTSNLLSEFKNRIEAISDFSSENIEKEFKLYLEQKELGMGKLLPIFRISLTGLGMGPSLFDIATYCLRSLQCLVYHFQCLAHFS